MPSLHAKENLQLKAGVFILERFREKKSAIKLGYSDGPRKFEFDHFMYSAIRHQIIVGQCPRSGQTKIMQTKVAQNNIKTYTPCIPLMQPNLLRYRLMQRFTKVGGN